MNRKATIVGVLALLLIAIPVAVLAAGQSDIAGIRRATAKYHRLEVAEADGFVPLTFPDPPTACISHEDEGAMGVHYIRVDRFDGDIVLTEPEVLLYDIGPDGKAKLLGVEYVVPEPAFDEANPQTVLGQELIRKTSVGPHPADPYYERHVWIWHRNPSGMFADWNPRVTCPAE
ncbi:MAG: hypothetical protein JXC32_03710 [Anaerolineae bacterium]|nr:hypothetical protein [Anaerolineae bacterium]